MALRALSALCLSFGLWATASAATGVFVSHFELQSGFVIVNAQVDGEAGTYILDSGAPGLVLNAKRHAYSSDISVGLHGTGGSTNALIVQVGAFAWDFVKIEDIKAIALDLSYLEARLGRAVSGLIGMDMFAGYGILLDYEAQTVSLHPEGCRMPFTEAHIGLPLSLQEHLPVITISAGERQMRFGVDTGARSNLICSASSEPLPAAWKRVVRDIELVGVDQHVVQTHEIEISGLCANGVALQPTRFIVSDLSHLKAGDDTPLDGILGHAFFNRRKVYIDPARTHIYLTATARDEVSLALLAGL